MAPSVNCSLLATRNDFDAYAKELLATTNGNLEVLSSCKVEVCGALWGYGNGDISGIGMIIGYVMDHALGFMFAVSVLLTPSCNSRRLAHIAKTCLSVFHDCATFLAFSIEIAATVVLVREDYGINTLGMGDNTVRITHSVAMLVLLPLAYALLLHRGWTSRHTRLEQEEEEKAESSQREQSSKQFGLFALCWLLTLFPFYSSMNAAFGPSKISRSGVLTPHQFGIIQSICFGGTPQISTTEDRFMTALVMLAYLPLSVVVVGRIIWLGVEEKHPGSRVHRLLQSMCNTVSATAAHTLTLVCIGVIPLLGCGLLWSIFRVQHLQERLTASLGQSDSDALWTFGQVVAVTLFAPVLVEGWTAFRRHDGTG